MPKTTTIEASASQPPPHRVNVNSMKNTGLFQPIITKNGHNFADRATRLMPDEADPLGGLFSANPLWQLSRKRSAFLGSSIGDAIPIHAFQSKLVGERIVRVSGRH